MTTTSWVSLPSPIVLAWLFLVPDVDFMLLDRYSILFLALKKLADFIVDRLLQEKLSTLET